MAPSANSTHRKTHRQVFVIGSLVVLLLFTGLVYRSGAVVCTPLGSVTTALSLCKPQAGETNWATAINNNFDILDSLFTAGTQTLKGIYGGVPQGAILLIDSGTCPSGFTEVTALRGRYPRGMLATGETIGTTVGTAMTANESRPAGAHTHAQTGQTYTPVLNSDQSGATNQTSTSRADFALRNTDNGGLIAGTNA